LNSSFHSASSLLVLTSYVCNVLIGAGRSLCCGTCRIRRRQSRLYTSGCARCVCQKRSMVGGGAKFNNSRRRGCLAIRYLKACKPSYLFSFLLFSPFLYHLFSSFLRFSSFSLSFSPASSTLLSPLHLLLTYISDIPADNAERTSRPSQCPQSPSEILCTTSGPQQSQSLSESRYSLESPVHVR
jgi:hypothetical protein